MADVTESQSQFSAQSGKAELSGSELKEQLARALRRQKGRALLLVAPLLLFILVTFAWPIAVMLYNSVSSPGFGQTFQRTAIALRDWDSSKGIPDEKVFAALVADLKQARKERSIGRAATRINYDLPGTRSVFTSSARKARKIKGPPYKEAVLKLSEDWGTRELWSTFKRIAKPRTLGFYVAALDRRYNADGEIVPQSEDRQIYIQMYGRTLWISTLVTVLCLLLGYPVAYLLSVLPLRTSNLLMIMVLLPFWTSLLVRTTSWIAILQRQGVLNDIAVGVGLISDDNRLQMIYNQMGTVIAMTHILLPFMILPLYSVMKTIPPSFMRAARSLGATQFTAYRRVYMPQTLPGVGAGSILVFILAIGYYITPALVGGRTGTMISNFIAFHMQKSLNWGMAAALGSMLLVGVLILYWLYNKIVGVDNMKFG